MSIESMNIRYQTNFFPPPGTMPAPEQIPLEDGLQPTNHESSANPAMETEATATTILASVKEQVFKKNNDCR